MKAPLPDLTSTLAIAVLPPLTCTPAPVAHTEASQPMQANAETDMANAQYWDEPLFCKRGAGDGDGH